MMSLPSLQDVITNTIRGAFLADAASMGTHWIYNPKEVVKLVSNINEPEFQDPTQPSFYSTQEYPNHYLHGMLSPFGEQLQFMTTYVAQQTKEQKELSGLSMSTAMYEWATTFGGRPDHATIALVENIKSMDPTKQYPHCGANDDQGTVFF
jgi:hypothetical protein